MVFSTFNQVVQGKAIIGGDSLCHFLTACASFCCNSNRREIEASRAASIYWMVDALALRDMDNKGRLKYDSLEEKMIKHLFIWPIVK